MNRSKAFCVVLLALGLQVIASTANAWDSPFSSWWYPSGSLYVSESAPYFALHPPVYYSYVVRRPYGYSPFPYPPEVLTPEQPQPSPVMRNPFVVGVAVSADDAGERPQVPQRMNNPFVIKADR